LALAYSISTDDSDKKTAVSSAKLSISELELIFSFNKSFIKIINNKGPNTVPCGTPQHTLRESLDMSLHLTLCVLSLKKDLKRLFETPRIPEFSNFLNNNS